MSNDPSPDDKPELKNEKEIEQGVSVRRRQAREESSQKGVLLLVGLVAIGGGLLAFAFGGLKDNAVYSKPIDDLMNEKEKFVNRPVRAEGMLVHGSLQKREAPCEYRFTITKNGKEVPVRFPSCVIPDTFKDVPGVDVGVTVEGQLRADNSFDATNIFAKCPSKYEMKEKQRAGEKMPHLLNEGT